MLKDFEPIRIDTSDPPVAEQDRVVMFVIDDVEYTAPRTVPGGLAWQALEHAGERGPWFAANFMAHQALGDKAIEALKGCEQLTIADTKRILGGLAQAYWGDLQEAVESLGKGPLNGSGA